MRIFGLLVCLSALVVATKPSIAKVLTGTLEGTVVDSRGRAVSGATVMIQTSDGRLPHATRTDARGHFKFARFESGQYDLRAHFGNSYSEWLKRVAFHASKPRSITLEVPDGRP